MTYEEFLTSIINMSRFSVRSFYKDPERKSWLEGSLSGLNTCDGKNPKQLAKLLIRATRVKDKSYNNASSRGQYSRYWRITCFHHEVFWICNVVSAVLYYVGYPVIVQPTAQGFVTASIASKGAANWFPLSEKIQKRKMEKR